MTELDRQLQDLSRRVEALERELGVMRQAATAMPPVFHVPVAPPPVAPSQPPRPPAPPAPPPEPPWWSGLTFADLFTAKVLAWAGGVVTLLGVVFFFVLAVNRGWIGPTARISLGAIASGIVFSGGLFIRRRYGHLYYSAYAGVGAGIGGWYTTLLAARLRYELVSDWEALILAAAIAAVGVAAALAWSSELIAGLGLVGATLAPAAVGLQNGALTSAGTTFAAVVFAGTALVAIGKRWQSLLAVGVAASLPQVGVLVAQAVGREWDVVAVTAAFCLLYLVAAIGMQTRLETAELAQVPTSLILVGAVFAGLATSSLFDGDAEGWALLAVAAVYGAAATFLFSRRDLSALLGAVGLAFVAVGLADLLSGPTLAIAWAAEAAVLAWLAQRIGELRYQLAALVYLGAALVHAFVLDAPPTQLYEAGPHPASGGLALVGVALAGALVAYYSPPWRSLTGWTAALAALYVASLGVLDVAQPNFEWGHVAIAGLWGLAALGVLAVGLNRSWPQFRAAGLLWLGATLAQAVVFFPERLHGASRDFGLFTVAAALLTGSLLDRIRKADAEVFPAIVLYVLSSLGLAVAGFVLLVGGESAEGGTLLTLAAFYCLVAGLVFVRDRDLSTTLWAPALGLAGFAWTELVSGTWLVLAWAATAAVLAVVADRFSEQRLQIASLAYLVPALGYALSLAPPSDFFQPGRHPAAGVAGLLIASAATVVFGLFSRGDWRRLAVAAATAATMYGVSLSILGFAEAIGTGGVVARFHAGHSAVSAVWGLVGLVALYVGLSRGRGWLQAVGFGLFAVSLAKIFLYDLRFLSSVTRALSFLAVGAVLLLGGFFVQRLGAERRPLRP